MNSPYHLITITTIVLLSYALTWLLSYTSLLPKVFHRRFWNTVLLIAFLLTAIIGLILTLQVNYKLELPALDTYMVWHVDAGIALALVSIFHIYWHWRYYATILKTNTQKNPEIKDPWNNRAPYSYTSKDIKLFAFLLGVNTLVVQTVFVREFMVMFQGNEMVIGVIIFFWMSFTGVGALFSNKTPYQNLRWEISLPLILILSGIFYASSNFLRFIVFLPGEEIGLFQVIWFSALFLSPVCFFSGYLFPKLVIQHNNISGKNKANVIYSIETLGSAIGGLIFTFFLGKYFRSIEIVSFLLVLNSFILAFAKGINKPVKLTLIALSIIILSAPVLFNFDRTVKHPLFINQELISYRPSPFGDIAKTQQHGQKNYYLNSNLLFNNEDVVKTEELVHFPTLQPKYQRRILILEGNFPAIVKELTKYNIQHIDFVEPNPVLFKKWENNDSLDTKGTKINLINKDFRKYIEKSQARYDVIILNLSPPDNLQSNRFYTDEFYESLAKQVTGPGVLSFNLPPVYNYLNDEQVKLFSSIYFTIKRHFKNVEFLVSDGTYLLASNTDININVGALAEEKGLDNEFVNSYYIDSWSMAQRNEDIKQNLVSETKINYDFRPIAFKTAIKNWLEKDKAGPAYLIVFILLPVLFFIVFLANKAPQSSLLLGGFSTSAIEIMLIYIFQVMFGNIYQYIGLLIALFMLGTTLGAGNKFSLLLKQGNKNLMLVQAILIVVPFLIFSALIVLTPGVTLFLIILCFAFIAPLLTGWLFHFAIQTDKKTVGYNYFIDLSGSALGIFWISIFILPQAGVHISLLVLSVINILSILKKLR